MRNFAFGEMNKLPQSRTACSRGVALPRLDRKPWIPANDDNHNQACWQRLPRELRAVFAVQKLKCLAWSRNHSPRECPQSTSTL
jgi:hypothetical protein